MNVNAFVTSRVIQLFTDNPAMRDNRKKTRTIILNQLKKEYKNVPEESVIDVSFHIDRAFRMVQQKYPHLRGQTWLKRQVMSGELPPDILTHNIYENQLKLFP